MSDTRMELPQGTLDLLILKAVALEPLHGWAISERLQQISSDALQVQQGSSSCNKRECRPLNSIRSCAREIENY